jgi:hypothetical protein
MRLIGICFRVAVGVGGSFADVVTGLGADIECALESERRGSTGASPSWFTSADISMVAGGWVVLDSLTSCMHRAVATPSR